MSLKESDWKAVLEQPRNVGMKAAGGTGISQALREYAASAEGFDEKKGTAAQADHLCRSLSALETACGAAIKKHKIVYPGACQYLAEVRNLATQGLHTATAQLTHLREVETRAKRTMVALDALMAVCDKAKKNLKAAKDATQHAAVWKTFQTQVASGSRDLPYVQNHIASIRSIQSGASAVQYTDAVGRLYTELLRDSVLHDQRFPHLK